MSNNRNRRRRQNRATTGAVTSGPRAYTFTHKGKTYRMPDAHKAMEKVPAGVLIDMFTGDGKQAADAEMQLGMALIRAAASDLEPGAMAALREKNMVEFGRIIGAWMQSAGVDAGESARSSA